jgi:hypothetical protein
MSIMSKEQEAQPRRPKMYIGASNLNHIAYSSPSNAAWWSAALPGFGYIHLGSFLKGFIFMIGEILCNTLGGINLAILYSFTGQFEKIQKVVNYNWLLPYATIYIYSIWDSYRMSVEMNKYVQLEASQPIRNFKNAIITSYDFNILNKRAPHISLIWSVLFPGIGHIYNHRFVTGTILMIWFMGITIMARLPELIIWSLTGQFELINANANYHWLMFLPSIYCFAIYDAYALSVSYNSLFKEEQLYYLQRRYRNPLDYNNQ